jgi:peroxiredoxin
VTVKSESALERGEMKLVEAAGPCPRCRSRIGIPFGMAFTLQIGDACPAFSLPATDGKTYVNGDFQATPVLVIAFTCNHCPYVINSEERLIAFDADYREKGARLICINSNEQVDHPTDDFDHMVQRAAERGFEFPYLRDESQEVALAFGALRTPHFYVFDADRKLRYTGRMDDSPRDPLKRTTSELRDAVDDVLAGREVKVPLTNPIGCNVKWQGKDHHWIPADACDLV